jgi:hypothetical protein
MQKFLSDMVKLLNFYKPMFDVVLDVGDEAHNEMDLDFEHAGISEVVPEYPT